MPRSSLRFLSGRILLQESKRTGNGCDGQQYRVSFGDLQRTIKGLAGLVSAATGEDCSVQKIAQANDIKDVNVITEGQRLCLPKGCEQSNPLGSPFGK